MSQPKLPSSNVGVQDVAPRLPAPPDLLNPGRHVRMGWAVILVGLVGFLLWAGLAPLDKGVPVSGTVMVSGHRKAVQHASGGIVAQNASTREVTYRHRCKGAATPLLFLSVRWCLDAGTRHGGLLRTAGVGNWDRKFAVGI